VASFFATKPITTGHGGLAAGSPEHARRLRDLVDYDGRDDWSPRFNYRTGEPAAALGLWQLARLPAWIARRRELAARYDAAGPGHWRTPQDGAAAATFYRYPLRVRDVDQALAWFRERGVGAARPVYRPLHHYLGGDFPHAEAVHRRLLSIPLYPALAEEEIRTIESALNECARTGLVETL
jgi:dTDP-4-amino-4,6-dideoxygalactose transaminase